MVANESYRLINPGPPLLTNRYSPWRPWKPPSDSCRGSWWWSGSQAWEADTDSYFPNHTLHISEPKMQKHAKHTTWTIDPGVDLLGRCWIPPKFLVASFSIISWRSPSLHKQIQAYKAASSCTFVPFFALLAASKLAVGGSQSACAIGFGLSAWLRLSLLVGCNGGWGNQQWQTTTNNNEWK